MAKLIFSRLRANYLDRNAYPGPQLYALIGHPDLGKNILWENTCAVRMSIALIGAGLYVPGHMTIKAGKFKGKRFQPGQKKLSNYLARPGVLGPPEKYASGYEAFNGILKRSGIVSFFHLYGATDTQNHIDIVYPHGYDHKCGNACYWSSAEVWFWPVK